MIKQKSSGHSKLGISRRAILQATAGSLSMPFVAKTTAAWAQERLAGIGEVVVQNFGGSLTEGTRRSVMDPFTKATGIKVVDVVADIADPQIMAMSRAGRVDWDIAQVSTVTYPQMHASGMFVPIEYTLWDQESLAGVPPRARLEDAVVLYSTSTVLAYDERVFPRGGPKNWIDFWDIKRFPGPRGLGTLNPWRTICCALAATGVPPDHIWPLTDDKLDRAFEKLDEIKPHITKWWTAGGEPPQLLINREYVMTSAYDGRVLSSVRQGAPIKFVWDHAVLALSPVGVILKGGPNTTNAQKLLAFWNRAQIAAAFTQAVDYPAPNANQLKYLPPDLIPLLSVNPQNASKTIIEDFNWLAAKRSDSKSNLEYLQERWLKWRSG